MLANVSRPWHLGNQTASLQPQLMLVSSTSETEAIYLLMGKREWKNISHTFALSFKDFFYTNGFGYVKINK